MKGFGKNLRKHLSTSSSPSPVTLPHPSPPSNTTTTTTSSSSLTRAVDNIVRQVLEQTSKFRQILDSDPRKYPWSVKRKFGGYMYRGERDKEGREHGIGQREVALIGAPSATYLGTWRDGKWSGLGDHHTNLGGDYLGEFRDDDYHGLAEFIAPNGISFKGRFIHGRLNGRDIGQLITESEQILVQRKQDVQNMLFAFYKGDLISKSLNSVEDIRRYVASFLGPNLSSLRNRETKTLGVKGANKLMGYPVSNVERYI